MTTIKVKIDYSLARSIKHLIYTYLSYHLFPNKRHTLKQNTFGLLSFKALNCCLFKWVTKQKKTLKYIKQTYLTHNT